MMGVTEGFPPLQHLEINDVWKIPRERKLSITPAMATALLDVDKYIGVDTDSGRTMSTERKDFLWLDTTDQAKNSVSVNGAGGGKKLCRRHRSVSCVCTKQHGKPSFDH